MGAPKRRAEPSLISFLKVTILGGLLFLLPVVIASILLGHAMQLAVGVVRPIAQHVPDQLRFGFGILPALAIVLLIAVCLLAGLAARTGPGNRLRSWFEDSFLGNLPQYRLVKSMGEGLAQMDSVEGLKPALVSLEGGWQLGYVVEPLEKGWVAVFLPQAPTPMSGNVLYLPANRIRALDISLIQAMGLVKRIGAGSGDALKGVDLRLPDGA